MKRMMMAAALSMSAALTTPRATAQSVNVFMRTSISLGGISQFNGSTVRVRLTNKDLLAALNNTGFSFGPRAQIYLRSTDDQLPIFVVRETVAGQVVTTDVSGNLTLSETDEVSTPNNLSTWGIWNFGFNASGGTDFNTPGLMSLSRGNIRAPGGGFLVRTVRLSAGLQGYGDFNGGNTIYSGAVSASFASAEPN